MGGASGICVGEGRGIQSFNGEMRERKHLEDSGVEDRLTLQRSSRNKLEVVGWIDLVLDRASSGLVNRTMDFWVPLNAGSFLDRLRNCQLH